MGRHLAVAILLLVIANIAASSQPSISSEEYKSLLRPEPRSDWSLAGGRRHRDDNAISLTRPDNRQSITGDNTSLPLTGDNICTRRETFQVPINVTLKIPYQVRFYAFCWSRTLRCSRYRTEFKNEIRTQLQDKQRVVLECCRGYSRSDGSTCLPVCTDMCRHGTCVGPDTCHCDQGFGGKDCSKFCDPGKWGPDCQLD